jgi:hypothetical protein
MSDPAISDPDADRRRLDWLEARGYLHVSILIGGDSADRRQLVVPGDTLVAPPVRVYAPTLRAAIDAAMAEWAAGGGPRP